MQKMTFQGIGARRVLVRADFNVPIEDGTVTDETRIFKVLPTLSALTVGMGRANTRAVHQVVLMSHLGRPKGEGYEEAYSLAPVARVLAHLLGKPVNLVPCREDGSLDLSLESVNRALETADIVLLENLRFDPGEKAGDPEFAQKLAALGGLYVNEAFAVSHRGDASVAVLPTLLPHYAGFLMEQEVQTLTDMLEKPARPFVGILGGSKVSDKIKVIDALLDKCDTLLIGGAMCFTFLAAQGLEVGASLCERDWIERAAQTLAAAQQAGKRLLLPVDVVCASGLEDEAGAHVVAVTDIPADQMGLDIGPATAELYARQIAAAGTVFWNGPMGVFERAAFAAGTKAVAEAVAGNHSGYTVIGGGDSVAAVNKFNLSDEIDFISTGGGASLQLIEGTPLPGVEALA
jgi:phosphoglycerate kinase